MFPLQPELLENKGPSYQRTNSQLGLQVPINTVPT